MILVADLFRKLSYGELNNMAVAVEASGTIKKSKQNQIIQFANDGLLKLFTRFPLSERSMVLTAPTTTELVEPLQMYDIKVNSILTAWGQSLTFHTNRQPGSIYVHQRQLHIPPMTQAAELQVVFQMRHGLLNEIDSDAELNQQIDLIPDLEKALTAFIAAEMYGTMNSADGAALAATYRAQYEAACVEAQTLGVVPSEMLPNQKFEERGFV